MTQLHVLQPGLFKALGVVIEMLVDFGLVHQVGEEFLQVALAGHEHEDGRRSLARVVVNDDVQGC